jgi:hypothetical protein
VKVRNAGLHICRYPSLRSISRAGREEAATLPVMPRHVPIRRSHKFSRVAPDFQRPALTRRSASRSEIFVPHSDEPAIAHPSSPAYSHPNPYIDYGRFLTPEGGILIIHKDHDLRFRHSLWRLFAWTLSTGGEAMFLFNQASIQDDTSRIVFIVIFGLINWLIVRQPVEIYRKVEIRPDCLIIDGKDIFWVESMECAWPEFKPNEDGSLVLCGTYGTRFVEYLTIRSFDERDRGPVVFIAHFQDAMQQLWTRTQSY